MEAFEVHGKILAALRAAEHLPYDGEAVGQLQHALQCADLARRSGHGPEVVVAALLHDVGRSSENGWPGSPSSTSPPSATSSPPTPPTNGSPSETSRRTLEKQGGPMDQKEIAGFEGRPGWRDAADLRRWDDLAKDPDAETPPLEDFEEDLRSVVSEHFGGPWLSRQNGIGYGIEDAQ